MSQMFLRSRDDYATTDEKWAIKEMLLMKKKDFSVDQEQSFLLRLLCKTKIIFVSQRNHRGIKVA